VPTATNADANYPAARLLTYDPTEVFRTTSGSTVITWDFGLSRDFDVVSLLHCNVSQRATLVVETSTNGTAWTSRYNGIFWAHLSADPGAGPYTEATHPFKYALDRNNSWYYSTTVHSARYVRLTVTDTLTTNMTFGRLFVGKAWIPSVGYQYGTTFDFSDSGLRDRTDMGSLVLADGRSIPSVSIKMSFITSQEFYELVYDFNYWRRSTREVLVCLEEGTDATSRLRRQRNMMYATLAEGRRVVAEEFNSWSQTWVAEKI
jgi:hypothetical protein